MLAEERHGILGKRIAGQLLANHAHPGAHLNVELAFAAVPPMYLLPHGQNPRTAVDSRGLLPNA
eukprot:11215054-Lingulodinium_polyedra.AAC.1